MRNTKVELGQEVKLKHLNEFMVKLKNSGYNAKFRKEILDSATNAFEKMLEDDKVGIKPMYRNKNWKKEERRVEKEQRKLNWYKNGSKGPSKNDKNKTEYNMLLFTTSVSVRKGRGQHAVIKLQVQLHLRVMTNGPIRAKQVNR